MAKVVLGGNTTYVGNLQDAFVAANQNATVTLLDNVTLTECVNVTTGFITLNLNGHTIKGGDKAFSAGASIFIIKDTGTAGGITASGDAIEVTSGMLNLEGGGIFSSTGSGCGISVTGGIVNITGENVIIKKLSISSSGRAVLSGGTYEGTPAIQTTSGTLKGLLDLWEDEYSAYFLDDKLIDLTTLQSQTELDGPVTVKPCIHEGVSDCQSNNNGTHALTCRACRYSETVDCTYGLEGTVESSGLTHTAHLTEKCTVCGYSKALGDVTVTIPKLTYGETTGKKSEFKCETAIPFGSYQPVITIDGAEINDADFERILAGLSAGEYKDRLKLVVAYPVDADPVVKPPTTTLLFPIPFIIEKAELAESMVTLSPESATYTGAAQKPAVTVTQGANTLTAGKDYGISYSRGGTTATDFTGVGTVTVTVTGQGNYTGTATKEYTISYMDPPELLYDGSSEMRSYYNGDVAVTAVPSGSNTYTVSDAINGTYKESYIISKQAGTVEKTLYFKDGDGHISAGVPVTVKFDLTPPTGSISVGAKWWQNALHFVSFGHYKVQEYTVTIEAEDKGGIGSIDYAIVTGETQYADVNALKNAVQDGTVSWTKYESGSKPTVPADSPCAVYARLTDNAGNITYIGTDGILLDNTPPAVSVAVPEGTLLDVTAGFTVTADEAADYYYVVLKKDVQAPSAEDIIMTCDPNVPAGGLTPNTAYVFYAAAVDKAVDITDSADGTPAGNIGEASADFTTKKSDQKAPAFSYTRATDTQTGEITLTVTAVAGAEYAFSLDGGQTLTWTDSNRQGGFDETQTVTLAVRMKETDTHNPSPTQTVTVNLAKGDREAPSAFTLTYTGREKA